ncbi:hypothetical protein C1645_839976 [Glomus cerebriforme]|uniref:Uncharacterized protein n=1 Tax=Glomus cerebriforme TaxID=658196 RepID=A0A397SAL8_9GLOM|nr:hypothetical protein C1645_839976 [Glomus cerebriforme]
MKRRNNDIYNSQCSQSKDIKINKTKWKNCIIDIITKRSNNIEGNYIFHEIIKEIFNKQLYEMEVNSEIKKNMEILIINIARNAREKIWNK